MSILPPGPAAYAATINLTAASASWAPVLFGAKFDPGQDKQAQASIDLVGNAQYPLMYMWFDDKGDADPANDELALRFRVDEARDNQSAYSGYLWIGLDVDMDGDLDVFLMLEGKSGNTLSVFNAGSGANTSPSTSSIDVPVAISLTGFNISTVSAIDTAAPASLDGDGNADDFVSFKFNFQDFAAKANAKPRTGGGGNVSTIYGNAGLTKDTPLRFVAASAQQTSALNGDIGGYNKTDDASVTYAAQGAFSPTIPLGNPEQAANPPTPVNQTGFTLTVPASITYGGTGTASTGGGQGTGAVSYSAGSSTGCIVDASTGVISVTDASGTCAISATKAGDTSYNSATDGPKSVTLLKASQTISFGALDGKTYGDGPVTVSATASSGLTVSFTASGSCTVDGSTVTITGAGDCTVTASQAGNGSYGAASPVAQSFSIARADLTVTTASASRAYGAANPDLSSWGTISGIQYSDNITATWSTAATTGSPVGSYPITATVSDPGGKLVNYNVTNDGGTLTVGRESQTISFGALADKAYGAGPITVSAAASSGLTVSFTASGSCTVDGNTVTITGAGTCTVTASQSGDVSYAAAVPVSQSFSIARAVLTVTTPSASRAYGAANPDLSSWGTISGIQYSDNITATWSTAATASSPAGSYPITATVSDPGGKLANYNVTNAGGTLTVVRESQTISFGALDGKTYGDGPITVSAAASSGLTVSFTASGSCTIDGSTVTITGAGSCTVTASQAGNDSYGAAAPVSQSFSIARADLTVTTPSASRVYGAANPDLSSWGTISGIQYGDNITAAWSTEATGSSPAGTYPITATVSDPTGKLANYNVTNAGGTLTVTSPPPPPPAPVVTRPTIGPLGAQTSSEGDTVTLSVTGAGENGERITYSASGLPTGLSIDPGTGAITGKLPYTAAGTYQVTVTVTDLSGDRASTSFTWNVADMPATLSLTATPPAIVGDGVSKTDLRAVLKLSDGTPVPGVSAQFVATAGKLSSSSATTGAGGEAAVVLTAPLIEGVTPRSEQVKVIVRDEVQGLFAEQTIVVTFLPASIQGVVMDGATGKPVAGAQVKVNEDFNGDGVIDFAANVTTGADGTYTLFVPRGSWSYNVEILVPVKVGDRTVMLKQSHTSKVGQLTGTGGKFTATKKVGGQLFVVGDQDQGPQETSKALTQGTKIDGRILTQAGAPVDAQVKVNPDGTFEVEDIKEGEYSILFQVTAPSGEKLAGVRMNVTVNKDGELAVQTGLIDPYGIVTDSVTGKPVEGALLKLMWADTPLNRSKGRQPDTLVTLPILPDFVPNQNRVPQLTTASGAYAWMVWPEGDYYILAEKSGYLPYDSRVEKRTVPAKDGEDSYITAGIIHVGQSLVEYDLKMQLSAEAEVQTPLLPKPERPDRGEHERYIFGYPDNTFMPSRSISRAEVATIMARILHLDSSAPAAAPYPDVAKEKWYAGYVTAASKAGIMTGYPDGTFRPDAPITRAEVATVAVRLRGLKPGAGSAFTDTAGHWAEGYLLAAKLEGLITGYPNGSFLPAQRMSRAEFVTLVNRLLNRGPLAGRTAPRWPDVPAAHWAHGDVEEASTNHKFEAAPGPAEHWLEDLR